MYGDQKGAKIAASGTLYNGMSARLNKRCAIVIDMLEEVELYFTLIEAVILGEILHLDCCAVVAFRACEYVFPCIWVGCSSLSNGQRHDNYRH